MWPHRRKPTSLPRPWDSPGKNTGVGCHFLLQCMKVKNESEVAQSCLTLSDPMDYSLPGSSIHGIFQARVLEWGAIAFSVVLVTIQIVEIINWAWSKEIRTLANENASEWVCGRYKLSGGCKSAMPHTENSIHACTHMKPLDASLGWNMTHPYPSLLFGLYMFVYFDT